MNMEERIHIRDLDICGVSDKGDEELARIQLPRANR